MEWRDFRELTAAAFEPHIIVVVAEVDFNFDIMALDVSTESNEMGC